MKRNNLYIIILLLLVSMLSSCQLKDNDLSPLKAPSKLVLYCFPSNSDTTWIALSESTPIYPSQSSNADLIRANIIFCVNDNEAPVAYDEARKQFYAVQNIKVADRITVKVKVGNLAPVMAKTSVPVAFPLVSLKTEIKAAKDKHECHYLLTMADDNDSKDYYAVRIQYKMSSGLFGIRNDSSEVKVDGSTYEMYGNITINTKREPLLYNITQFDDLFGIENDFYQNMYIFDDEKINGKEYTLHLIDENYTPKQKDEYIWYYREQNGWNGFDHIIGHVYHRKISYRAILYKLDKETYTFMKNINDQRNNGMGESGLAPIVPNYTNVINGIGIMGGMNRICTDWIEIE